MKCFCLVVGAGQQHAPLSASILNTVIFFLSLASSSLAARHSGKRVWVCVWAWFWSVCLCVYLGATLENTPPCLFCSVYFCFAQPLLFPPWPPHLAPVLSTLTVHVPLIAWDIKHQWKRHWRHRRQLQQQTHTWWLHILYLNTSTKAKIFVLAVNSIFYKVPISKKYIHIPTPD